MYLGTLKTNQLKVSFFFDKLPNCKVNTISMCVGYFKQQALLNGITLRY